ncbi:MAG: hypothetical protein A4E72_00680 [Syntrophus sp. PtaU1.Bin208]|nr:MAG: hypothetical protein A4E72_00680 [Syntrophus sp. PtaU1.Bin208]
MKNPDRKSEMVNKPALEEAIARFAKDGKISCAEAMQIALELGESRLTVGRMLDQREIHLGKCQLGILGCIHPENKIVQAAPTVPPEMAAEIRQALQNGCLSCAMAWHIAEGRNISPMDVSAACESLEIRIKPCQFGIF